MTALSRLRKDARPRCGGFELLGSALYVNGRESWYLTRLKAEVPIYVPRGRCEAHDLTSTASYFDQSYAAMDNCIAGRPRPPERIEIGRPFIIDAVDCVALGIFVVRHNEMKARHHVHDCKARGCVLWCKIDCWPGSPSFRRNHLRQKKREAVFK